jgi:hypothetical protein
MKYRVYCGMRPASIYSPGPWSTRFETVEVEADHENEARLKAIDECYRQFPSIEHVNPGKPKLVELVP